jgi:hypothetical protein
VEIHQLESVIEKWTGRESPRDVAKYREKPLLEKGYVVRNDAIVAHVPYGRHSLEEICG